VFDVSLSRVLGIIDSDEFILNGAEEMFTLDGAADIYGAGLGKTVSLLSVIFAVSFRERLGIIDSDIFTTNGEGVGTNDTVSLVLIVLLPMEPSSVVEFVPTSVSFAVELLSDMTDG
jgi:hypothetical protein